MTLDRGLFGGVFAAESNQCASRYCSQGTGSRWGQRRWTLSRFATGPRAAACAMAPFKAERYRPSPPCGRPLQTLCFACY